MKQKNIEMDKPQNVDEYIATFPADIQKLLQEIRTFIQGLLPAETIQVISYGIPTFKLNGNVIHFAGYANHIGLYPGAAAIVHFAEELKNYKTLKGTIQFPITEPFPKSLVKKIVLFCLQQNLNKKK
ncbi:iron chaperone [Pedobacter sp.]|uniref:iron chaperone n=1 Tax=Pedobacter sp. TaxID=1411316 RepID=UPI00396CA162